MNDVFVVGADLIRFGRYPDRTPAQLGAEAALLALDDAELTVHDIDVVYASSTFNAASMIAQQVLKQIGQTGVPCVNVSNACASGATAFREAFIGIKSGLYDVALVVGVEKNPKGLLGGPPTPGPSPEGLFGSGTTPAMFAEAGMVHAAAYGTTIEQFAQVAVKNHHHATMNPKAMYQIETPLDQVLASEMIAWPLTKLMCSANVDGAAATILVSERKARELGLSRAARIIGSALASDPWQPRNPALIDADSVTRLAVAKAYEMAGLGPQDLDMVELHDCGHDKAKDPEFDEGMRTFAVLRDVVAEALGTGGGDVDIQAQSCWAGVHGLASLLLARGHFPWAERDSLIAGHLRNIARAITGPR